MKIFNFKKKKKNDAYGFFGDYQSFEDAIQASGNGYAAENILQTTLKATLKVKNGEAVFERDSFIFDKVQYSWPLLSCLFKIAVNNDNKINVLDFGGALGTHYFQNKDFLNPIQIQSWIVVEQGHYVNAGNKYISDDILKFATDIDNVEDANILLMSGVLQYLPEPYKFLEKAINKKLEYILIDRTPFNLNERDRLTIQKVPPSIYEATYPHWFFNEKKFLNTFNGKYELITDFDDMIDNAENIPSKYKGFFFKIIK